MYCFSLLPVFIGLDTIVARFSVWYYGKVRVRCLIETFGRGARAGDSEFHFGSKIDYATDLATAFLPNKGFPLQSACVRCTTAILPHHDHLTNIIRPQHMAFHSTYDSYTTDLLINTGERVPFNFLVRTKRRDDQDWAVPQVDVILLSFSLVDSKPFQVMKDQIQNLRKHAPGTPIILVGDSDRTRSGLKSIQALDDLIKRNEEDARNLVRTEGLELYVGLNYRTAVPGEVLISAMSLFCSSS